MLNFITFPNTEKVGFLDPEGSLLFNLTFKKGQVRPCCSPSVRKSVRLTASWASGLRTQAWLCRILPRAERKHSMVDFKFLNIRVGFFQSFKFFCKYTWEYILEQ